MVLLDDSTALVCLKAVTTCSGEKKVVRHLSGGFNIQQRIVFLQEDSTRATTNKILQRRYLKNSDSAGRGRNALFAPGPNRGHHGRIIIDEERGGA